MHRSRSIIDLGVFVGSLGLFWTQVGVEVSLDNKSTHIIHL
jgi:hypothetical protein